MKYMYEMIGTLLLVFTVGMAVVEPQAAGMFAPIAIGGILAALVFAGAHVSGAHYNPAVSLAIYMRKGISLVDMVSYWVAQFLGAGLASILVIFLKNGAAEASMEIDSVSTFTVEALFTFALCWVILNVATAKKTKGNNYFGLSIGLVVMVGAFAVGPISGGAFNPAVAFGAALMNLGSFADLWIYVCAQILGAIVAATLFHAAEKHS